MNIHAFFKNTGLLILGLVLFVGCSSCDNQSIDRNTINLEFYAIVNPFTDIEVSGLVKSRVHEDVFWIHGDSGDDAAIYPIRKNGEIIEPRFEDGISLKGIDNEDWEDIATDNSGNLYVGDIGNNCFCRHDLMIHQLTEPALEGSEVDQIRRIRFAYPADIVAESQHSIPDAEALLYRDGSLYIFTKESDGEGTMLFEMINPDPSIFNELQLLNTIDFDDKVTAADISLSGDSIAILTSSSVWLLSDFSEDDFFSGTIQKVFFEANQVESIAFSGDESLLIAEETGELYEIALSEFR